jgi:hypothetical protein
MSQGLKEIQFFIPIIPEELTREIENLLSLTPIPNTFVKEIRSMSEEGQTLRGPELLVFHGLHRRVYNGDKRTAMWVGEGNDCVEEQDIGRDPNEKERERWLLLQERTQTLRKRHTLTTMMNN